MHYDAHTQGLWSTGFTPDFARVAISCAGKVQIVDVAKQTLLRELAGHKSGTRGIVFAPDGRLWTGGQDGHVRIWDVATGQQVADVVDMGRPVTSLANTPSSDRIGAGCEDGTITIFDATNAHPIVKFDAEAGGLRSITCSSDARSWIAAGILRTTVWNVDPEPKRESTYEYPLRRAAM